MGFEGPLSSLNPHFRKFVPRSFGVFSIINLNDRMAKRGTNKDTQNSKYAPGRAGPGPPSVPVAGRRASTRFRLSQAASVKAGSEPTMSRIMCQAAMLRAPSGEDPWRATPSTADRSKSSAPQISGAVLRPRSAQTCTRQPISVPLRVRDCSADNTGCPRVHPVGRSRPIKHHSLGGVARDTSM